MLKCALDSFLEVLCGYAMGRTEKDTNTPSGKLMEPGNER